MIRYLAQRFLSLVVIILGVTVLTFALSHLVPADPAALAAGPGADREQVEAIREAAGFNRPVHEQYLAYLGQLAQMDFGTSIITHQPVAAELLRRLPASLELIGVSFLVYVILTGPLAVKAATTRHPSVDSSIRVLGTVAHAIPAFVLGIWVQVIFFYHLGWLPAGGRLSISEPRPPTVTGSYLIDSLVAGELGTFVDAATHLVLPAGVLILGLLVTGIRLLRSTLIVELDKEYVTMGRLRGLAERTLVWRHAGRNSLIPAITIAAIQFGYLLGGTLVVETIFAWPGLGSYAFESIIAFDYQPVMGVVIVTTALFVLVNFVADMSYPLIDPRVKLWGSNG